jgi:hypothetical protein
MSNDHDEDGWHVAFHSQVNEDLYTRSTRYALRLTAYLGGDNEHARELVQAAIVDTLIGVLCWDPESCSLEAHINSTIRSRCHHDRDRAQSLPHVPLDTSEADGVLTLPSGNVDGDVESDDIVRHTDVYLASIREQAIGKHDNDVLAVLECFGEGRFTTNEMVAATGWPAKRVRNARRRIKRYIATLPRRRAA